MTESTCGFERKIYEILGFLGVPIRMLGHRYMEDALQIMLEDEEAPYAITKLVYFPVARKHGTSSKQVESAIRTAVRAAWYNGNCERHERILGYSRNTGTKPCNSEFLLRVLAYLRFTP